MKRSGKALIFVLMVLLGGGLGTLTAKEPKEAKIARMNTHYQKKYNFSEDMFTSRIPGFEASIGQLKGKPGLNYLEIGVYEGASVIWMIENVLTSPTAKLTGIDIFPGNTMDIFAENLKTARFEKRAMVLKGSSAVELRKLPLESFDIIYIDGSHVASDTITDAVLSWGLLKHGGTVIFDDYNYKNFSDMDDPRHHIQDGTLMPEEARAKYAIDAFMTIFESDLKVVYRDHRLVALQKI